MQIPAHDLIPGAATRAATESYARSFGAALPAEHFSDFLHLHLKLSSLGIGTFPGAATDEVDAGYIATLERALCEGINVIDTASHYRYGRSARAVGVAVRRAMAAGLEREQFFLIAKGGFVDYDPYAEADFEAWYARTIAARGLGRTEDRVGRHLMTPAHIARQIDALREATRLATLDAFLIDQPEVEFAARGKEATHRRLEQCFAVCEQAAASGRIGCYGVATYDALRAPTDAPLFESLASLVALAERAAAIVHGARTARHHFRIVSLPFNQAMPEGYTRFNQATGQGNVASTLQAARQLRLFVVGSHGMLKGHLARQSNERVAAVLSDYANDARRSLQFNRSTPGLGVSLTGVRTAEQLDDMLAVARVPPLATGDYLGFFTRAD